MEVDEGGLVLGKLLVRSGVLVDTGNRVVVTRGAGVEGEGDLLYGDGWKLNF